MINMQDNLSIYRQCELLKLNRSSIYYKKVDKDVEDGYLMNEIQEIWLKYPFYGYRRISVELRFLGYEVNHKRVQRLMQEMNLTALYPKPKTSIRDREHYIYPYLLEGLAIERPNQVWATDITYIRLRQGFVYLVALIDIYSRYVVGWDISISLEADFCVELLALSMRQRKPEIINSDQGCQFTSHNWVKAILLQGVKVSMDGKGRCLDNVYIERFWRSLKQESVYLRPVDNVPELRGIIKDYILFYNERRWHQSLGYCTPASLYLG
jgi:putative transposase